MQFFLEQTSSKRNRNVFKKGFQKQAWLQNCQGKWESHGKCRHHLCMRNDHSKHSKRACELSAVKTNDEPPTPHFNDEKKKNAFWFARELIIDMGGRGGYFSFYSVQDCSLTLFRNNEVFLRNIHFRSDKNTAWKWTTGVAFTIIPTRVIVMENIFSRNRKRSSFLW